MPIWRRKNLKTSLDQIKRLQIKLERIKGPSIIREIHSSENNMPFDITHQNKTF